MNAFNIYLIGVGGQGIGMLSDILLRSIDRSGQKVVGVDTHGLAQRGGTVESMIRLGTVFSPLISQGGAQLVVALEQNEALRGLTTYLAPGRTLVYYNTEWQSLATRLSGTPSDANTAIEEGCRELGARQLPVFIETLPDTRMQNMALLATLAREGLIPGVGREDYEATIAEVIPARLQALNLSLFESILAG